MNFPGSLSGQSSPSAVLKPSVPWAPPPSPPPEILSEGEEAIASLLSLLEVDAAFLENDLHVMLYTLESLNPAINSPESMKHGALQILSGLEDVENVFPKLVKQLENVGTEVRGLDLNITKQNLEKHHAVIDKTLIAAGEMIRELRSWAGTICLGARDLEGLEEEEEEGSS